jgi:uncharacterized protein (DUF433 family)
MIEIVRCPGRCAGHPTVGETRITVHDIIAVIQMYDGDVEEAYREELSRYSWEQINSAIDFYRSNQEEIDEILRKRREDYERFLK